MMAFVTEPLSISPVLSRLILIEAERSIEKSAGSVLKLGQESASVVIWIGSQLGHWNEPELVEVLSETLKPCSSMNEPSAPIAKSCRSR